MSINLLPNDCLLTIFDNITELDDLINCYKVCARWSLLITKRAKRVKYLINHSLYSTPDDNYREHIYIRTEKQIDGQILENLFSNLRIIDIDFFLPKKVELKHILEMVKRQKSLKGFFINLDSPFEEVSRCCEDIDFLSLNNIFLSKSDSYDGPVCDNGYKFKQLHVYKFKLRDYRNFELSFPSLDRLNVYDVEFTGESIPTRFKGEIFLRLKIIEFFMGGKWGGNWTCPLFRFIDHCPVLQSAHLSGFSALYHTDESIKNESLRDLVIEFHEHTIEDVPSYQFERSGLYDLMIKYPNLKHLSLRNSPGLKDEHIKHLVKIAPNLTIIDVRGSEVTQRADDFIQDYCKKHRRSIKLYFGDSKQGYEKIKSDFPEISIRRETICRGFDFMKNCFFKDYRSLPCFLDPMDEED